MRADPEKLKGKQDKKVNRAAAAVLFIMLLAGLGLLLYPTVSNWIISLSYHQEITGYKRATEDMSEDEKARMREEACAYNAKLAEIGPLMEDPQDEALDEYYKVLDPLGTGVMGYVEVPSINVRLPISHGADDAALQTGAGHIPGTSLPVGGESSHCIISAHRGMVSARLFTDIDRMKEGDMFFITVLGETHAYEVDMIKTVIPYEVGLEEIKEGVDRCTLLTCTPYGINTHRLLVQGIRVPYDGPDRSGLMDEVIFDNDSSLILSIGIGLLLFIIMALAFRHIKKKRKR